MTLETRPSTDDQEWYGKFEGKRLDNSVDGPFQVVMETVDEKAHDKDDLHDPYRDPSH